jgi:sugar phosphate permease
MSVPPPELTGSNRLWGILGRGEPAPPAFVTRQAYYPWLVISIACVSAFIGNAPAPLLHPDLFRFSAFRYGALAVFLSYALLYGMFLLMSFALVRGYAEPVVTAGLRLAIIPITLGVVAPISGALNERLGPRILTALGMVFCVVSVIVLCLVLRLANSLPIVMVMLALFGVGLGLFIAPNNDTTVHAVPSDRSGQAGAIVNLMRILGTATGVSASSTVLSWRLEVIGHPGERTSVPASHLIAAVGDALLLLAVFGVLAGVASVVRGEGER